MTTMTRTWTEGRPVPRDEVQGLSIASQADTPTPGLGQTAKSFCSFHEQDEHDKNLKDIDRRKRGKIYRSKRELGNLFTIPSVQIAVDTATLSWEVSRQRVPLYLSSSTEEGEDPWQCGLRSER